MISISRCGPGEIERLMRFIDQHWQPGHILATNRDLMDWQHGGNDGSYDFLLAMDGGRLLGVLGYIAMRRFDPDLASENVIWLALWKIQDGLGIAGLGLRLLSALKTIEPYVAIAVNGINLAHPPMYEALNYRVSELRQYFVTNAALPGRLINAPHGYAMPVPIGGSGIFTEMTAADLVAMKINKLSSMALPKKTPLYFLNRFLRHPFYRYRVFLMQSKNTNAALLATRTAEHSGARAIRIVDFAGDPAALAGVGNGLVSLMTQEGAEYIDFWQTGFPNEIIRSVGFEFVDSAGPVTVPNYFEPFAARNGRILCAIRSTSHRPAMIFRADGDQDRPSRVANAPP